VPGTLAGCLRETDLVGWHHAGRAAGAVLTGIDTDGGVPELIASKVVRRLQEALGDARVVQLRVRVYRYGPAGQSPGFRLACAGAGGARRTRRPNGADVSLRAARSVAPMSVSPAAPI
jgi:hypothetical protein